MSRFILKKAPYNFECDWLVELSDNKSSYNKLNDSKTVRQKLCK